MAAKKSRRKNAPAPQGKLAPRSAGPLPGGYAELLEDLKGRVRAA